MVAPVELNAAVVCDVCGLGLLYPTLLKLQRQDPHSNTDCCDVTVGDAVIGFERE